MRRLMRDRMKCNGLIARPNWENVGKFLGKTEEWNRNSRLKSDHFGVGRPFLGGQDELTWIP